MNSPFSPFAIGHSRFGIRPRRQAFTLIELILSLTMVAMLAAGLYMSLSTATRARASAAAGLAPIRTAMLTADLLRQDFESVLPPDGTLSDRFIGTSESAGADSLEFVCLGNDAGWNLADFPPAGQALQDGPQPWSDGPRRVILRLRTDVTPPMLVRQVIRNLLPTSAEQVEEEILCRNVKSFTLAYFNGQTWQPAWLSSDEGNTLPAAVQMTMEILLDPDRPGQPPRTYKVVRTFPLACATQPEATP